jgi:hypothetical protein
MEKCAVKFVIFNDEDFGYWKNRTRNYLLSLCRAIWEIVQEAYVIPDTLDHAIQGELQKYENNYKVVLVLVAMWLTPSTLLTHLFWSLLCLPCVQLLMSNTRASPMMRSPCW